MANFDDTPTVATPVVPNFQLTPPEVITPITAEATVSAVPLKPQTVVEVDGQVARFIDALMSEDLHGAAFMARLGSAAALGREEIANAARLTQGRFLQCKAIGADDVAACAALGEMRTQLDMLHPRHEGDLLAPQKILGVIPVGNRLKDYFRKFENAGPQLQKAMSQLVAGRDDVQRDIADIEATRTRLWAAMQQLASAAHHATTLDAQLSARVGGLQITDPERAIALQQGVLHPARQNLAAILTQQAACVNGYLALDVLKKAGREMMNGCSRVVTTGVSVLAMAQAVARATGHPIQLMELLKGIGSPLVSTVDASEQFAGNPMVGIDKIRETLDQARKAVDAMDTFLAQALEAIGQNRRIIQEQLAHNELRNEPRFS